MDKKVSTLTPREAKVKRKLFEATRAVWMKLDILKVNEAAQKYICKEEPLKNMAKHKEEENKD